MHRECYSVAIAASAAITAYVVLIRRMRITDLDFLALAVTLVAILWVLCDPALVPIARERFTNASMMIYRDALEPSIDRLVKLASGKTVIDAPKYVADDSRPMKVVSGDEIASALRAIGPDQEDISTRVVEYGLISGLFCIALNTTPGPKLLEALGVGPVQYDDTKDDDDQ